MDSPEKSPRLWLKRAALFCASVFVALLVVEVALRLLHPAYNVTIPWSYEYDAELAFRLKPGAHLFRTTDFQQEARTNRAGDSNFQESFDDYPRLVFTVGDSFTQGIGVPADASYPFQLDLFLNRDAGGFYVKRFGVVNLGVSGFGGEQNFIALRRHVALSSRPPSFILYLGCDNDLGDDILFRRGLRQRQFTEGDPYWGRLAVPARWLANGSQIGLNVRRIMLERIRARAIGEVAAQLSRDGSEINTAEFESPLLERLSAYAKGQGATLVVSWSDANSSYYWLKGWASRNGVAFADWAPRTASVQAAVPALPLDNNHSGGHHRAWANRVIAEEFARQMGATK
ncbi:MAG TPA: SGNH/GDSL hydrolase family protein [Pyrinomonadaceae bacterium]|jgi:hypothetical protein|nr:SGNH/GDSL hydrolase family protein [Pyrinomonadaceae bacterium]